LVFANSAYETPQKNACITQTRASSMSHLFLEKNIKFLLFQRNVFVAFSFFLILIVLVLSTFLFFKHDRVVIVPPVIEKEFWVDANHVSPTYLEQFGYFLGQLLLAKSSQSAASQRSIILRHTDPSYAGILRQRLIEEEEVLKKQSTSYVFYPVEIKVNPEQMSLLLTGDRLVFIGGKEASKEREGYILRFNYSGSRLLLKEITLENKEERGSHV
jgi:conjugal transfer pilus assembly protein TraE